MLGHRLQVRTEASPELVRDATELVGRELEELSRRGRKGSALTTALLACLNLAGEYLKAVRRSEVGRAEVASRLERLRDAIKGEFELDGAVAADERKRRLIAL